MRKVMVWLLVMFLISIVVVGAEPLKGTATASATSQSSTYTTQKATLSEIDEVWLKIAQVIKKQIGNYYDPVSKGWKKAVVKVLVTPSSSPSLPPIPPSSSNSKQALLDWGIKFVGAPYVLGGEQPPTGTDAWTTCWYCLKDICQEVCKTDSQSCSDCVNKRTLNGQPICQTQCSGAPLGANCRDACYGIWGMAGKPKLTGCNGFNNCQQCPENSCYKGGFDCQGFVRYVITNVWPGKNPGYTASGQFKACNENKLSFCKIRVLTDEERKDVNKLKAIVEPGDLFFNRKKIGGQYENPFDSQGNKNPKCWENNENNCIPHVGFIYDDTGSNIKILHSSGQVRIGTLSESVYAIGKLSYGGEFKTPTLPTSKAPSNPSSSVHSKAPSTQTIVGGGEIHTLDVSSCVHKVSPAKRQVKILIPSGVQKKITDKTAYAVNFFFHGLLGSTKSTDYITANMGKFVSQISDKEEVLVVVEGSADQTLANRFNHVNQWMNKDNDVDFECYYQAVHKFLLGKGHGFTYFNLIAHSSGGMAIQNIVSSGFLESSSGVTSSLTNSRDLKNIVFLDACFGTVKSTALCDYVLSGYPNVKKYFYYPTADKKSNLPTSYTPTYVNEKHSELTSKYLMSHVGSSTLK